MIGVLLGLSTAWVWGTTSLLVKVMAARVGSLSFNAFRMAVSSLFILALLPFYGGLDALGQLSPVSMLALAFSAIIGIGVGDTLYFWSIGRIGASRALPISGIYPLFAWVVAVPLLGEPVTGSALLGTAIVLVGVYLLAPAAEPDPAQPAHLDRAGVLAAITAAILWGIGTAALKFGLQDGVNAIAVSAFRLPVSAIVLLGVLRYREGSQAWRGFDRQNFPRFLALALYSTALGEGVLWVLAVDHAGAARAALLNTTSPLFVVPLAILFLHERVTVRIALGAICSVIGIALIL